LGAEASVGLADREQLVHVFAVDRPTLALAIRTKRPPDVWSLVPAQPDPMQGVEDHLLRIRACTRLIGVLDPQHELAALLTREHVVEQRDVGGTDVRITGRRWCNSHTHGPWHEGSCNMAC